MMARRKPIIGFGETACVYRESGGILTSSSYSYGELTAKPTLLLHSCCGPCSAPVIEELAGSFAITVYYYNPNITDRDEYNKRLECQKQLVEELNGMCDKPGVVSFIEGEYNIESFYEAVRGLEGEREGGARCRACIRLRLEKTAATASMGGFDCFAATLSVSPHKDCSVINMTGLDISLRYGIDFIDRNFKKNGGYQRSIELSKKYSLYRQDYCGCEFSMGGR